MTNIVDHNNIASMLNLSFEDFRRRATDSSLSRHEKAGFPDSYREGREEAIFRDITSKLKSLETECSVVLEIGPGCTRLPIMLQNLCKARGHELIFVDSEEMLSLLPENEFTHKYPGCFPHDTRRDLEKWRGKIRTVVVYSVLQYVITGGNLWEFLVECLAMLSDGGEILLGDIPNKTMRGRFFGSPEGRMMHEAYMASGHQEARRGASLEVRLIDDHIVLEILEGVRARGFHCWVLPQNPGLPFATRREDILIRKP